MPRSSATPQNYTPNKTARSAKKKKEPDWSKPGRFAGHAPPAHQTFLDQWRRLNEEEIERLQISRFHAARTDATDSPKLSQPPEPLELSTPVAYDPVRDLQQMGILPTKGAKRMEMSLPGIPGSTVKLEEQDMEELLDECGTGPGARSALVERLFDKFDTQHVIAYFEERLKSVEVDNDKEDLRQRIEELKVLAADD